MIKYCDVVITYFILYRKQENLLRVMSVMNENM